MNVPDSSAWIEYFRGSPLKATFRPIVQDLTTLIVPSIVIYEVHKWMLLDVGEDAALTAKAMMLRGKVIVLDPELATAASRISIKHKLAMADAIIYATALVPVPPNSGRPTAISRSLPSVRFFRKKVEAAYFCRIFVKQTGATPCRADDNLADLTHGKVEPALDPIGGRRQGFFINSSVFAMQGRSFLFCFMRINHQPATPSHQEVLNLFTAQPAQNEMGKEALKVALDVEKI